MVVLAAGAIIYRPSKGFLLLRKRNYWEFPKGRVDPADKNLKETALREVKEETGLSDIKFLEGFCEEENYAVPLGPKRVDYFLGITTQEPKISSEHLGYCWCMPSEVQSFLNYESKKKVFKKALAYLRDNNLLKTDDKLKRGLSLKPQNGKNSKNSKANKK